MGCKPPWVCNIVKMIKNVSILSYFYQEVLDTIADLQNTFQTRSLIIAGDFNAVLSPEDSSSKHVTKRRTTELLKQLVVEHHLINMAAYTNKKQHTWFRRNNNRISSWLDLILTSLPVTQPKYTTSITIFDHAWVQASFGQKREVTISSMKDYVLGSDEFLINFYELLGRQLATCVPHNDTGEMTNVRHPGTSQTSSHAPIEPDLTTAVILETDPDHEAEPEEDRDMDRKPMDHCLTAHDIHSGRTDLHFVNELLHELTILHTSIERDRRARKQHKLIQASKRLYHLHKKINKQPNDHPAMTHDQEEYNELQRDGC